jgi:hypothetical protein
MSYSAAFKVGVVEKIQLAFTALTIYTNLAEIFFLEGNYESYIQTTTSRESPRSMMRFGRIELLHWIASPIWRCPGYAAE